MKEANTVLDLSGLSWRKSSRSTADGSNGDCVEIAFADQFVAVRDSKNPDAAHLAVPNTAFAAFVRAEFTSTVD
ncbi:DUF397 domain-containing protein [Labedaea rhizosphaerae]|uniref:Uncharacterized protein DUF397 n=1 Tax=Labedaea rhizosphaerae TaxID=598644 RepID=A0A4R6SK40_LABRH|nr:DUF397 domain-containing protein [Labedaea rhizosphaerae]TDQ01319.1 uncharacterized protein DUF397 [Labedaea rhizosphaerae]